MNINTLFNILNDFINRFRDRDNLRLYGEVEIKHIRNGRIIKKKKLENVITDVGKAQVAGLIGGIVTDAFTYIAIGDGDSGNPGVCSSESSTDTALGHELQRASATATRITTSVTNDTLKLEATFNFTGSYSICESGVFDAASNGNMLARKTFSVINVADGDSLQITWKIQVQ